MAAWISSSRELTPGNALTDRCCQPYSRSARSRAASSRIVRGDEPAVAECAQVLCRIKAESGQVAEGPRAAELRCCAPVDWAQSSMTRKSVPRGHVEEGRHFGRISIKVDGNDGRGPAAAEFATLLERPASTSVAAIV